jgi:hypothetical protein
MKMFTDRELEFLIGVRTNWGKLYLSEVGRLLTRGKPDMGRKPGFGRD